MKIISVHTPKCGGTSVARILAEAFGDAFLSEYADDPADPVSERNLNPARFLSRNREFPDGIKCIHGHFHPGQFRAGDAFLFTMLRDPVDNIASIYSSWKASTAGKKTILHDYFLRKNLNILEMAQLPLIRNLYSDSYFGAFDMSRFNLIGRHERREEALTRLGRELGIRLDVTIRENVTPGCVEREELLADRRITDALRDILANDVRFYERHCR